MYQFRQRGVALITALLVMAVCAALATYLLVAQRLLLNQAELVKGNDRMLLAMQGVSDWAIDVLTKTQNLKKIHDLKKDFYGVKVSGSISALGGRFNLNTHRQDTNQFIRLLNVVAPDLPREKAQSVAQALINWQQSKDPNSSYYANLPRPYRSAGQPLVTISELRLVRGVSARLYQQLVNGKQTYVSALPSTENNAFNINWVTPPVLMTIGVPQGQAESLLQCRRNYFFTRLEELPLRCGEDWQSFVTGNKLTVKNDYYLVTAKTELGDQHRVMRTLLYSQPVARSFKLTIVWQEIDGE